jgi:anaerobic magnesium-protoporphyrin IX monomethyl ester cyclase
MSEKIVFFFPPCNVKVFGSNEEIAKPEKAVAPPLGILYLAAELLDAGYRVECCDYNAETYTDAHLSAMIADADLVGVSVLSFNRRNAYDMISRINEIRPGLPVIAGGADCMLHHAPVPGTVLTVVEEAETIIVEIVRTVLDRSNFAALSGVVYLDGNGARREGLPFAPEENIDTFRFPRRDLLRDNKGYSIIGKKSRDITTMITSRGCPRRCAFCAHGAVAYRRYRSRSVENVLDELELIAAQGYEIVGISDDNFTADKNRAQKILQGIIDRGIRLTLVVQGRVDAADYDLFCLMRKAGVRGITFGLESGNQEVLDFYNKGTTVAMNEKAVRLADKAGLYTGGIFIFGAPTETMDQFKRTYEFAASLPLDITTFWILDYTFGSKLWADARRKGIIDENECNVPAGVERGTSIYFSRQIETYAQRCFFRYYRRPAYWVRQIVKLVRLRDPYFVRVMAAGIGWIIKNKLERAFSFKRRVADQNKCAREKPAGDLAIVN